MCTKRIICLVPALFLTLCLFAETRTVTVQITGVKKTGPIHVAAYLAEEGTQNTEPAAVASGTPGKSDMQLSLKVVLDDGPYIFMVLQDVNENGRMDTNMLHMPKEPFGISGYTGGIPKDMKQFIITVDDDMTLEIPLQ